MNGLLDTRRTASLGARPAHFPADLREIADLIELCFFDTLDEAGRQMLQRARAMSGLGGLGWHTYRWMGRSDEMDWYHGFVWTDGGKIVGNVSLAPSHREPHTWAIANVSVHPTHRRRGIARDLTRLALDEIRRQGGRTAVLQVKAGNQAAMTLYHGLGFREVTQRTLWTRLAALCPEIVGQTSPRGLTRPVRRIGAEWQEEFALVRGAYPEGLAWRWPVSEEWFRPSLARRALRLLAAESEEHWIVRAGGEMVGCLIILHRLAGWQAIAVAPPAWRGVVEASLLRAALRAGAQHHPLSLESAVTNAEDALARLGFARHHTLIWMKKPLEAPGRI
ncbi:MAG: GNAT family N-acetyltransferase [Chloroflexi bacterium]|nr:GNAT family N-acetyltransferase [Chloroflexota bacterium]